MTEEELETIEAWADQYKGIDHPSVEGRVRMMQIESHVYGQLMECAQEMVPALVAEVRRLQKEVRDLKVDEAYRRACEL